MILGDTRLEKVFLLLQIDHFRHPRERIVCTREQQVEADRVIEAVVSALVQDEALLSAAESKSIRDAIDALILARNGSEQRAIKAAIDVLDKATADFAARRMDASIKKALTGHTLDEFSKENLE